MTLLILVVDDEPDVEELRAPTRDGSASLRTSDREADLLRNSSRRC